MHAPDNLLPPPGPVKIPARPADGHKGTFGRVAVVAGSTSFTGAAYLAATAAIRGGAGQVRLLVESAIHPILAVKFTEVEVASIADGAQGSLGPDAWEEIRRDHLGAWATVGVVGPGLGRNAATWRLVRLLQSIDLPLVVDADGLNALAEAQDLLCRPGECGHPRVLTPHPGEMSRLVQRTTAEVQANRQAIALDAAVRWGAIVVLKGAHTVVAAPDGRVAVDPHAVPALASGGTGDVLAGLIGALLAQGSPPFEAAVAGVYVHAAAGRKIAADVGLSGLAASDLLPVIPRVMQRLRDIGR
jgi:hydroxyethylthiazole kinase-like uncharacterized protein yjeF